MRITLLALCILPGIVYALPGDRDQPIHITADKAVRDELKGVTIYSGNVHLVQGSMELDADKLTIYHNEDVADEIIAEGKPAKMRQQPEVDKGLVHAHAEVITYYKYEDKVHLKTDARIEREGAVVDGDAIDYFIAKQLITAESDQSREDAKVVVVIPPSVHKESDSEDAGETQDVESGSADTAEKATSDTPVTGANDPPAATDNAEEGVSGTTASE